MRVKGSLVEHKEVTAAMGVKIVAAGLETAVAGGPLFALQNPHRHANVAARPFPFACNPPARCFMANSG